MVDENNLEETIARYKELITDAYHVMGEIETKNMLELSEIYSKIERYEATLNMLENRKQIISEMV